MLQRLKNLRRDELVKGGFILFIMLGLYNVLNYVFQISMAKMLGPADYSILAVLMSIIYIISIPNEAIQTVITKYTSLFGATNSLGKIKDLFFRSAKKGIKFAGILFILLILLSFALSYLLKIEFWLLAVTSLSIFFIFLTPISRGILQGRKKFAFLGLNLVIESFVKVILALLLVFAGWKLYGAISAVIIGSIMAFFLAFFAISDIIKAKRERAEFYKIYEANLPILIAMVSIVLMYSLDIIFARAFFSPQNAGEFAFVSLIGKVIIFVSASIGKALFPLSSEGFEKGKNTSSLFKKALLLVICIAFAALLIYYFFPEEIITIISLGSPQYLGGAGILFIISLAYAFLSISNIIILYKLSINKIVKKAYFLLFFVLAEVVLISIFHENLIEYSISLLVSNLLIFLYSLFLIKE